MQCQPFSWSKKMTVKLLWGMILLVTQSILFSQAASAEKLLAGPMAGPPALRSFTIWFQAEAAAKAQLSYWSGEEKPKTSPAIELKAEEDFAGHITLANLQPGAEYHYRVLLNNKPATNRVYTISTQALWQWRTDPPNSKVLLGSCAYINDAIYDRPNAPYGGGYEIFSSMAAQKPDLTVWMGDNLYLREVDYDSVSGMAYRYRHDRALPELQAILTTGAHAAIWDDHDYGPNDSNSSFGFKADALELFKRYWANPSYGLPDAPGVFTVVHHNDADFFMLDDRWYRDSDAMVEGDSKAMLGERQISWLKNALINSTANFKIIVNGSQILDDNNRWEGWNHFRTERDKFTDWLLANKLDGVMFLSGDRHHTELLRLERPNQYPLYELTCSPLTAGTHKMDDELTKPIRVTGTLVGERNFCSMEFSGPYKDRKLTLRSYSSTGKPLWEHLIQRSEISNLR
jgi:alkaline phosphatase D